MPLERHFVFFEGGIHFKGILIVLGTVFDTFFATKFIDPPTPLGSTGCEVPSGIPPGSPHWGNMLLRLGGGGIHLGRPGGDHLYQPRHSKDKIACDFYRF